jgi:branched-chain amino acid transport system permease protein
LKFAGVRLGSIAAGILACAMLQMLGGKMNGFIQLLIILAGLYVTLSVSLNLINGITGQFSIGHAAFYQVGAYTAGVLAQKFFASAHLPVLAWLVVVMIGGAITAAIAGLIVGLPSLRLRGDYLAIVTLGFGQIINIVAKNQQALGKAYGMDISPHIPSIFMVWLLAFFTIAICRNLLKNVHGLSFLAVREDEVASAAMGVNVTRVKVAAFVLGSAFAGAAGALYAHALGFISPTNFAMDVSFIILTMVVLGGTGSITGSILAAVVLFYIPEKMRDLQAVPMSSIIAAAIALVIAVAVIRRIVDHYRGRNKGWYVVLAIVGGVFAQFLFSVLLKGVPAFQQMVEGSKLRLVVFAVTLVILMLFRPQGIFAHHEFSWSWVKKLFGKKDVPTSAVSA